MKKGTFPYIVVELINGIDQHTTSMIEKYWLFENGDFVNRPTNIAADHQLNRTKLSKLVNENSSAQLILGKCLECKRINSRMVNVQSVVKKVLEMPPYLCISCEEALRSANFGLSKAQAIQNKLYHSLRHSAWTLLSKPELDVLLAIIRLKTKRTLQSSNFRNDWRLMKIANRLRYLGLISYSYNYYDDSGFDLYFLPDLLQCLTPTRDCPISEGEILRFRVPMSSIDSKKKIKFYFAPLKLSKPFSLKKGIRYESRLRRITEGELFFELRTLSQQEASTAEPQSPFKFDNSSATEKLILKGIAKNCLGGTNEWTHSRQFTLSHDIVFERGVDLECKVAESPDESLYLSIFPKNMKGYETDKTDLPMSIESLIEQFFRQKK